MILRFGASGPDVRELQAKLASAGFALSADGVFGKHTLEAVRGFQQRSGLTVDGLVGPATLSALDAALAPRQVELAAPSQWTQASWPHDDTYSLTKFYGQPWQDVRLLTHVTPKFKLSYAGAPVHGVLVHAKCAAALQHAFGLIWSAFGQDQSALDATGFTNFSGSYNFRNVRGAQRLSCHSFGAALDFDAEHNAMGTPGRMDQRIIGCFKAVGAFWGGDFRSRRDPMHFQFANELAKGA